MLASRYLLAEGERTVYVAFMGTKVRRDLITNAAVIQELLWKEHRFSIEVRIPQLATHIRICCKEEES